MSIPFEPAVHSCSKEHSPSELADSLGFPIRNEHREAVMRWNTKYASSQSVQATRWEHLIQLTPSLSHDEYTTRLRKLSQIGVPAAIRADVWNEAAARLAEAWHQTSSQNSHCMTSRLPPRLLNADGYGSVGERPTEATVVQVDKDLHRTFPSHPKFNADETSKQRLRHILLSYAAHNPAVGYCQGMNFIAGMLLLLTDNELISLNILAVMVEQLFPQYFLSGMQGATVDGRVLLELLAIKLPALNTHLSNCGVAREVIQSILTQWILCLFAGCMPSETVMRIWDIILLSGKGRKCIFRVGLGILMSMQDRLLQIHDADALVSAISSYPIETFDADSLLNFATSGVGSIPKHFIHDVVRQTVREVLCGPSAHEAFLLQSLPVLSARGGGSVDSSAQRGALGSSGNTRKCLCFCPLSRHVWSGDDGGCLAVWDADTMQMLWTGYAAKKRRVTSIASVHSEIWAALQGGTVQRFCFRRLISLGLLAHPGEEVHAVASSVIRRIGSKEEVNAGLESRTGCFLSAFTAGGDCIGFWESSIESWNAQPELAKTLKFEGEEILCLNSSVLGDKLFVGSHACLSVVDVKSASRTHRVPMDFCGGVTEMVESLSPHRIWTVHGNSEVGSWDVESLGGSILHRGTGAVARLVCTPDECIWVTGPDGNVEVFRAKNDRKVKTFNACSGAASACLAVPCPSAGVCTVWVATFEGDISAWAVCESRGNTPAHGSREVISWSFGDDDYSYSNSNVLNRPAASFPVHSGVSSSGFAVEGADGPACTMM